MVLLWVAQRKDPCVTMADRSKRLGTYVVTTTGDGRVRAFVPPPLPPEPPVQLSPLQSLLAFRSTTYGKFRTAWPRSIMACGASPKASHCRFGCFCIDSPSASLFVE